MYIEKREQPTALQCKAAQVGAQPKSVLVVTVVTTIRKRDQAMTSTGRGVEPVLHEQLETWTWSSVMVEMTLLRESSYHSDLCDVGKGDMLPLAKLRKQTWQPWGSSLDYLN